MRAILRDSKAGKWRLFERPRELIVARTLSEVLPALHRLESEASKGVYAAGFVAYEAAPAFDKALRVKADGNFPLLWFGLFDGFNDLPDEAVEVPDPAADIPRQWSSSISRERYLEAFNTLQKLIRSGETYQVNFTYRLTSHIDSSPWALFQHLTAAQRGAYGAYIHAGEWVVCSASPELFFESDGTTVVSKPMKGTAPRGLWFEQDLEQAELLRSSEKERAENVMIVDMVRNDLGRIATPGSVRVPALYYVERYPTVWQMTSTVMAETDRTLPEVMAALFPPASITGAPKASTTGIIAAEECSPRRIYTGTIGFIDPDGRAQFNVAIRTALINRKQATVEYGVGGGIVADSDVSQELAEAVLKSRVLTRVEPEFDLLETILWSASSEYFLKDRHLRRLSQSAAYFGFKVGVDEVRKRLDDFAEEHLRPSAPDSKDLARAFRVRLLVSRRGNIQLTATPLIDGTVGFDDVMLAADPIDSTDPFLYHKTTNRTVYERALGSRPGVSDVLLFNERHELTESTIANLVVEIAGTLYTPPLRSGLLPGTARAQLLAQGGVEERVILLDDLKHASKVFLLNSLRGMHEISVRDALTVP
jgi:para-aminobenzoate synthetase/4-amino-4-deoxychorismate lyase